MKDYRKLLDEYLREERDRRVKLAELPPLTRAERLNLEWFADWLNKFERVVDNSGWDEPIRYGGKQEV